jgi:hypothetical protein
MKLVPGLAVVLLVLGWFAFAGESKADAVRSCLEEAGATTKKSERFELMFPYLVAAGTGAPVESFPELEGATIYGVAYGEGEALLFVGEESDDARAFQRTLVELGAVEGVDVPARRSDYVLLIWTVPLEPYETASLDDCVS